MGAHAVDCLLGGKSNIVICEKAGLITECDIGYALKLDRMYKNKLKPGDLDGFSPAAIRQMETLAEMRRQEIRDMYNAALTLM